MVDIINNIRKNGFTDEISPNQKELSYPIFMRLETASSQSLNIESGNARQLKLMMILKNLGAVTIQGY
jgi:hypothetical protein